MTEKTAAEILQHCIKPEPYRGFVSHYCGDGLVAFRGPNGAEVKGASSLRTGWLEPAWISAKAQIDAMVEEPT